MNRISQDVCKRSTLCCGLVLLTTSGPSYFSSLTLIAAGASNIMSSNAWNKITYPFAKFNSTTFEVWEWISNLIIKDVIT